MQLRSPAAEAERLTWCPGDVMLHWCAWWRHVVIRLSRVVVSCRRRWSTCRVIWGYRPFAFQSLLWEIQTVNCWRRRRRRNSSGPPTHKRLCGAGSPKKRQHSRQASSWSARRTAISHFRSASQSLIVRLGILGWRPKPAAYGMSARRRASWVSGQFARPASTGLVAIDVVSTFCLAAAVRRRMGGRLVGGRERAFIARRSCCCARYCSPDAPVSLPPRRVPKIPVTQSFGRQLP